MSETVICPMMSWRGSAIEKLCEKERCALWSVRFSYCRLAK